jgi:hypothetical protein
MTRVKQIDIHTWIITTGCIPLVIVMFSCTRKSSLSSFGMMRVVLVAANGKEMMLDYNFVTWPGSTTQYLTCDLTNRAPAYIGVCQASGLPAHDTFLNATLADVNTVIHNMPADEKSLNATLLLLLTL